MLALSSIAKHSVDLAEAVVEAEILPSVLLHMAHPDENVSRIAAILTREICKHTLEVRKHNDFSVKIFFTFNMHFQLAQFIVNTGGIAALIELIDTSKSATRLPAIMVLGYIAGHSDQLALAIIGSKVRIVGTLVGDISYNVTF